MIEEGAKPDDNDDNGGLHEEPHGYYVSVPFSQHPGPDEDARTGGDTETRRSGDAKVPTPPALYPPSDEYLQRTRMARGSSSGRRSTHGRRMTSLSEDSVGTLLVVGVAKWDNAPRCIRRTTTLMLWLLLLIPALATLLGVTSSQVLLIMLTAVWESPLPPNGTKVEPWTFSAHGSNAPLPPGCKLAPYWMHSTLNNRVDEAIDATPLPTPPDPSRTREDMGGGLFLDKWNMSIHALSVGEVEIAACWQPDAGLLQLMPDSLKVRVYDLNVTATIMFEVFESHWPWGSHVLGGGTAELEAYGYLMLDEIDLHQLNATSRSCEGVLDVRRFDWPADLPDWAKPTDLGLPELVCYGLPPEVVFLGPGQRPMGLQHDINTVVSQALPKLHEAAEVAYTVIVGLLLMLLGLIVVLAVVCYHMDRRARESARLRQLPGSRTAFFYAEQFLGAACAQSLAWVCVLDLCCLVVLVVILLPTVAYIVSQTGVATLQAQPRRARHPAHPPQPRPARPSTAHILSSETRSPHISSRQ